MTADEALLDDLTFDALFNVRDLGGYGTPEGATVRRGRLYRADGIHRAAGDDVRRLVSLGLRTVIDLRSPRELEVGRFEVEGDLAWHHAPVIQETWAMELVEAVEDDEGAVRFLVDRYVDMTQEGAHALSASLHLLADPESQPALFHCAAGKDRTGVLAALVLSLLGVDDAVVADDYARSAAAMDRAMAWFAVHEPSIADVMTRQPRAFRGAPRDAMLRFLRELEQRHGSVRGYVRSIGVGDTTVDALRESLLA